MTRIEFDLPDEKTPGYLRRVMAATRFNEMLRESKLTVEAYENLITFLMGYVSEPQDRGEAREALLDCSLEQYNDLLKQVTGNDENPTSPEQSEKN